MKKFTLLTLLGFNFTISYAQQMAPAPVAPGLKGQLVFTDDFNKGKTPDPKHWLYRINAKMGGVSETPNVLQTKLNSGQSVLQIKFVFDSTRNVGRQYGGGGVVSTHNFGYGYYETVVKLYGGRVDMAGFHQSFWSMGLTGTNEGEGAGVRDSLVQADLFPEENRVLEIDGFEHDSKHAVLAQNYHIYSPLHTSQAPQPSHSEVDINGWVKVAYEWRPGSVAFFVNDKLISTLKLEGKWDIFSPQNFWLTALPVDVKAWGGLKKPAPGAAMNVDYFKFYTQHMPKVNRIGNAGFEYQVLNGSPTYPVAWIVARKNGNDTSVVKVLRDSLQAYRGNACLAIQSAKPYKAAVKQILEYIPNGRYTFSAFVKSPGKQNTARISIASGRQLKKIVLKGSPSWRKVELPNVMVRNHQAIIAINATGHCRQTLMIDAMNFSEQ